MNTENRMDRNVEPDITQHPAFKKGAATAILHTAARALHAEGLDELAVPIELLLAAVAASADPREIASTVRVMSLF
ncbi:MAG: hypothetical protein IT173_12065 [Acidobacteria bacterium]|nr:hypothetical protein [Acidobacteriota bacterium]